LGGAPTTHILKPAVERFAGVVSNEALCMTLAAHMNLPAAKVETRQVEDVEYLLVERYDRKHVTIDGLPGVERLHQEDFCQAQNIVPEMKYQKEGGPSFKQCFALLRNVSTAPVLDLANLLDAAIFNYLIGNNDAHGKNFSLVYPDKEIRLAPLYDAISTIYYPELNSDMAMRMGREYSSDKVTPKDFEQLAGDAGLAKPLVRRRVPELAAAAIEVLNEMNITDKVSDEVAGLIRKRCTRAQEEFRN
jgi:serine/threonine-protein kinase HipA